MAVYKSFYLDQFRDSLGKTDKDKAFQSLLYVLNEIDAQIDFPDFRFFDVVKEKDGYVFKAITLENGSYTLFSYLKFLLIVDGDLNFHFLGDIGGIGKGKFKDSNLQITFEDYKSDLPVIEFKVPFGVGKNKFFLRDKTNTVELSNEFIRNYVKQFVDFSGKGGFWSNVGEFFSDLRREPIIFYNEKVFESNTEIKQKKILPDRIRDVLSTLYEFSGWIITIVIFGLVLYLLARD